MMDGEEEKFQISFKVLGNEIFSMELKSQSKRKNWVVFGIILLIALSILFHQLLPVITTLSEMF
jgi:hypothetical protein